jgi:hypothetical protein
MNYIQNFQAQSEFEYTETELQAVQSLKDHGVEVHCVTYGNDLCKCVESDLEGICIHLPNSERYDEANEEFDTFVVSWDGIGTGRDSWMFDDVRTTALFVRTAPHPDTHTDEFIQAWIQEMIPLAINFEGREWLTTI